MNNFKKERLTYTYKRLLLNVIYMRKSIRINTKERSIARQFLMQDVKDMIKELKDLRELINE